MVQVRLHVDLTTLIVQVCVHAVPENGCKGKSGRSLIPTDTGCTPHSAPPAKLYYVPPPLFPPVLH